MNIFCGSIGVFTYSGAVLLTIFQEQGWRSVESTRTGSILGVDALRGLSLLLVLVPAPRVFLRVLWFSFLHTNIPKFQFNLEIVDERATLWKPLKFLFVASFIYLFILFNQQKTAYDFFQAWNSVKKGNTKDYADLLRQLETSRLAKGKKIDFVVVVVV